MKSSLRRLFERLEAGLDHVFAPAANPFHYLGALGFFFFWIIIASGIYLYIFFDTGVTRAYESVEHITHTQWYAGGIMRSLHRYASNALVVVVLLHLIREYAMDRLRGRRWFGWVLGVPLIGFMYASGITGYWLVWDQLAQYIAIVTTEWLDSLSLFGQAVARNFLNEAMLTGRFFTLMVFLHVAVPLFMLFLMWVHVQRLSYPRINPPRQLAIGMFAMLLVLSLAKPAVSQGAANLDRVPAVIGLDWFYLPFYPLLDYMPGPLLWAILAALTILLLMLPWLPPRKPAPAAVVYLDHCNGCGRCVADCPFSAVSLVSRTDGQPFAHEAAVHADKCVSCGICVGACPSSTPFRSMNTLLTGIDLPQQPLDELKQQVMAAADGLKGDARVIILDCEMGPAPAALDSQDTALIRLPCISMVPPPFLDFIIARRHADGVLLAGCRSGNCHYRLGIDWTQQRIAGQRDPYLRQRVPRERIESSWVGEAGTDEIRRVLWAFQDRLRLSGPLQSIGTEKPSPNDGEVHKHV